MKKSLLVIALIVGISSIASAQAKFGLKGGISIANAEWTTGNVTEKYNSIVTPNFGLTVDFKGTEKFNLQSGLLYSGYGGKFSNGGETVTNTINALSIPLLAKLQLGGGFYGYAGPQLSFVLSAKSKYEYNGNSGEEDIKSQLKSTALLGVLGFGYKIQDKIGVFGEYQLGLSNVANTSSDSNAKLTANALSLGLNYSF